MPVCTYTCVHVCIYAYMHVCICACMHRCMYAYIHICINACMHRCMHAEFRMFLSRMMTANWSWVQVFEQHGDYKLVLQVIWPRKRPQRGPDCSPSEDYLCFLSTPSVPWWPSEVVPRSKAQKPHNRASAVPPYFRGRNENFGVLGAHWRPNVGLMKVILIYKIRIQGWSMVSIMGEQQAASSHSPIAYRLSPIAYY